MNFFDIWPWWVWLLTTFGIGGLIALAVLAPALASALLSGFLKLMGAAIRTPLGAGIIAGCLGFGIGHYEAKRNAIETCNARIEDMKVAAREAADARDTAIGKIIDNKFSPIVQALGQQADANQKLVDTYAQTITTLPSSSQCPLGAGPLRLRQRR